MDTSLELPDCDGEKKPHNALRVSRAAVFPKCASTQDITQNLISRTVSARGSGVGLHALVSPLFGVRNCLPRLFLVFALLHQAKSVLLQKILLKVAKRKEVNQIFAAYAANPNSPTMN